MLTMGQKPLEINHFESCVVALITSANAAQGGTIRSLSAASGVSRARLDRILRGESSMTTTDFQRICDALGLVPWKVALAAETGRSYAEVDDALAERQSLKDAGSSDPL
jgi:DNA-binding helix-turn-helix protein